MKSTPMLYPSNQWPLYFQKETTTIQKSLFFVSICNDCNIFSLVMKIYLFSTFVKIIKTLQLNTQQNKAFSLQINDLVKIRTIHRVLSQVENPNIYTPKISNILKHKSSCDSTQALGLTKYFSMKHHSMKKLKSVQVLNKFGYLNTQTNNCIHLTGVAEYASRCLSTPHSIFG